MPKFASSHRLCRSSLQQCYATACTVITYLSNIRTYSITYRTTSPSPAMGHLNMPPVDFQLFNFSGHFTKAQTLTFDYINYKEYTGLQLCHCLLHEFRNILVCCPKFIFFQFCALLAPNPGDAWCVVLRRVRCVNICRTLRLWR